MSYRRPDTGDPELDRKWIDEDYAMLFPKLEAAVASGEEQRFAVWLDKLTLIDRDRTVLYVRGQWDALNHIQRVCARLRLGRDVADLPLD